MSVNPSYLGGERRTEEGRGVEEREERRGEERTGEESRIIIRNFSLLSSVQSKNTEKE
jgi:hypothetical protein